MGPYIFRFLIYVILIAGFGAFLAWFIMYLIEARARVQVAKIDKFKKDENRKAKKAMREIYGVRKKR